jgi:hypothetical protein
MSHFLDRLTHFTQPKESFADGHGLATGEAFAVLGEIRQSVEEMAHGEPQQGIGALRRE